VPRPGLNMQTQRKTYTIERHSGLADVGGDMAVPPAVVSAAPVEYVDVMRKLDDLGVMIQPAQAIVGNIAEAYRREVEEVIKLRDEMVAIQKAISETKRHVVSFHAGSHRTVTVNHAAGELGAVVIDTEGATNTILAAAERIEMLAGVIQSEQTKDAMKLRAGEIAGFIMTIYEACNFQDLTGQRITRVCETLAFVEERVNRMADVWGGLDSLSLILNQEVATMQREQEALGTHALAAGPALAGAGGHVGQVDIDALFV
jgi:chemotaxis protein CheZ